MAAKIINCNVCGAEIASSAKICPKCGAKNKKGKKTILLILVVLIIVTLLGMKVLIGGGTPATVTDRKGNVQQMTSKELMKIEKENQAYFHEYYESAKINVEGTVKEVDYEFLRNGGSIFFDSVTLKEGWTVYLLHDSYDLSKLSAGTKIIVESNIYCTHFDVQLMGCESYGGSVAYDKDSLRKTKITVIG